MKGVALEQEEWDLKKDETNRMSVAFRIENHSIFPLKLVNEITTNRSSKLTGIRLIY